MDNTIKKRSSISTRLTLMVAGILVMAVLVSGSLALFEQQRQLNHALETKAASLVQFMAQVTPLSILSLNFVEMNNEVKKVVLTDEDAVYALILNEQGIPLVYFFKDTDPLVTNQVHELVETRKPLGAIEVMKQTGRILEVTAPIFSGEKRIGSAILGLSLDQMRRALLSQIIILGIFLIVIIGFSIVLLRLVLRQILHPVEALTTAATQISKGNLDVVLTGADRTDELGILASAFKSMTNQLRELIVGLEQHVAELKRTSQALRESEERFRTAFENANVGVCLVAANGNLLRVNDAMCQMFGYSRQELEQMNINSIAYPDDLELSPTIIQKAVSGETNQANFDKRYIHKQGHLIWGHVSTSLVRDGQGEPLYFISYVQDITARKRVEKEIQTLNQELEQRVFDRTAQLETANKELEAFAYSVSHDLRAPLRAISGFTAILTRRHRANLNDEGQHYLNNIVQAGERMERLIDDLLAYSRLGRLDVRRGPVALRDIFTPLAQEFAGGVNEIGGTLEIADDLPTVIGDRTLLTQIFTNLLDNAFIYRRTDVPVHVSVTSQVEDKMVIIRVCDNGIGISPEYHEKIFNIFQRLHSEAEYPGTGIGLATVKKSVDLLGGRLWVESEVGKGSAFFIKLPKE